MSTREWKYYIGILPGKEYDNDRPEIFGSSDSGLPSKMYGPKYLYIIGPFKTIRAAEKMGVWGKLSQGE